MHMHRVTNFPLEHHQLLLSPCEEFMFLWGFIFIVPRRSSSPFCLRVWLWVTLVALECLYLGC